MFRGANAINLDAKGRLTVPTKYRAALMADCEGQMVCTIHTKQPCLLLYPLPEWEDIEMRLSKLSSLDEHEARILRLLLGYATEGEMDKNGRILIPAPLRDHAELEKPIMMVGQMNKFELWSADNWQARIKADIQTEQQGDFEASERLRDFVL